MQKNWRAYLNKMQQVLRKLRQLLHPLFKLYLRVFYIILSLYIFAYLFLLILSIIKEAISPTMDVKNMVTIAERGTIISATLAVLTFTYSSCFENFAKKPIVKIGEQFLASTV